MFYPRLEVLNRTVLVAANLAPLIDRGFILVEGTMNDGNCEI